MNYKKIFFNAQDGLKVTADFYEIDNPDGLILLCHRSHCNRAEYRQTAPRFNQSGFACIAIDQRSGMNVFGEKNETKNRARRLDLPTGYLDARADIEAAIEYAYALNDEKPVILLGSSYSASLALLISTQTDRIRATIAFSPSECLKGIDLSEEMKSIDKPTYVTSPQKEVFLVTQLMRHADSVFVDHFIPVVDGFHGSKTLWDSVNGSDTYWTSLDAFLKRVG